MRRTERLGRWRALGCIIFSLYLVLLRPGTEAWAFVVQQARPMEATAMASSPAEAMDCVPCARCYVAPLPSAQRCGGEDHEPEVLARPNHAVPQAPSDWSFGSGAPRAPLPLRIAYCRWRN
ncbi:MAG: hypothetical protein M0Z99_01430 [Betaproteobacteria bacterium]|nr:hypothetical protein [Betaproteobacteria bacterium]